MPLLGLLPAATAALIANAPTRDRMPFGLLTIQPTFTVSDWSVATRVLDDFLGLARKEKGCSYCGYTRSLAGDKLFISEAFNSAESVVEHVQAYKTIKPALSGAVSLERMQLHGPADEIEKCVSAMPAGTQCFPMRAKPSGFSFFSKQTGGLMTAQTLCSLKPMLLISDWEKAEKIMADYVELAALEPGLIYCGWTSDEDSTRAFLRVAHSSADAVLEHLDNVGPCLEALLGPDGGATLENIELHGPKAQVEKVRSAGTLLDGLDAEYYATASGFQKFECWSSYVAQPKRSIKFG